MRNILVSELLRNTDDVDELISIVENGHPSICSKHPYWKALKKLETMEIDNIYNLYAEVNS